MNDDDTIPRGGVGEGWETTVLGGGGGRNRSVLSSAGSQVILSTENRSYYINGLSFYQVLSCWSLMNSCGTHRPL